MKQRISSLLFNQVGVLLLLIMAALLAYVIIGQPAWAIDPLREAASDVLGGMGVALVLLLAWAAWLGWLLSRGFRAMARKWRYVLGLGFLTTGAFAVLSYFHTEFPLIGVAPLGGELGGQIRGPHGAQGVFRTVVIVMLGAWLVAPVLFNHAALGIGRGARATSRGIGTGVSRLRHREQGSVMQEVDDYLASNAMASRAAQMEALRAADEYRRATATQRVVARDETAPRGLAYLEPTSPKPLTPRPAGSDARSERKSDPWPGLKATEPSAPEPQPSIAATATMAPPAVDEGSDVEPAASEPTHEIAERSAVEESHEEDHLYVNGSLQADVEETLALAVPIQAPWGEIAVEAVPATPEPEPRRAGPVVAPNPLPSLELLAPPVSAGSITEEHLFTAALIEETLAQHGVEVSVSEIRPGPSVTMFGIVPGWNRKAMSARARALAAQEDNQVQMEVRNRVKVDSILAREKDLALALAAPTLRIQAPVPGESLVGVEMPNRSSSMVTIRTVMESPEYERMLAAGGLPVALGLASAGEPVALDLLKMPHLLIAGATGSGKSVCINTVISSIICHQDPAKVRMLLVDPKRVELTPYNGIPHLVTPVVVDPDKVVRLLKGVIQEMMRRYKLLEEAGARNIVSYNRNPRATEEMPYFVICIDELADLMMTASFDVEQSLCRLAQLGRATGIHLIVATQRPSVDVLTGLIKANFPSRIAFAVASQVDSRTILDSAGAERLLGRGDMLFISSDSPKPKRVQGVFISEDESAAISEHWRQLPPDANLPEIPLENMAREAETAAAESAGDGGDFDEGDSLYERALQVAAANRQLSTSLLQRRLRIGYPRAARLMDQLEDEGIVAAAGEPGKPRDVIYLPDEE
ncbi:MAG: DNA translocase FtsK [Chloroflexota bacterium]|nr:DNA translocase FtsK [Chloroflexota bacterium]MDE2885479.1 DNA translocase FtsK [Chloroflexota bacterium]